MYNYKLLILKTFIVPLENNSQTEYFLKFIFNYLFALRLQSILINTNFPYILNFFLLSLIIIGYSVHQKRKVWITLLMIFFLYVFALNSVSIFSLVLIVNLLIVPFIDNSDKIVKYFLTGILILFTFMIITIIEKSEKNNVYHTNLEKFGNGWNSFNDHYFTFLEFNLVNFIRKIHFNPFHYEFQFLKNILDFIIKSNF